MSETGNIAETLMCVEQSDDICIQAKLQRVSNHSFHFPAYFHPHSHLLFSCGFPKAGLACMGGRSGRVQITLAPVLLDYIYLQLCYSPLHQAAWTEALRSPYSVQRENSQLSKKRRT